MAEREQLSIRSLLTLCAIFSSHKSFIVQKGGFRNPDIIMTVVCLLAKLTKVLLNCVFLFFIYFTLTARGST